MNKAIGIDIGGTNIKAGIIDGDGNSSNLKVFSTHDWISSGDFSGQLEQVIREFNENGIIGCGIAIPGLISFDRKSCFQVTAIPEINNLNVVDRIASVFPDIPVRLENDANAAAYG
jgi:glucokinase